MKLLNMMLTLMVLSLLTTSCGSSKSGEADTAVCVWNKVSLRTEPNESSKWITAINLGEKVSFIVLQKVWLNGLPLSKPYRIAY
mgnify:CR=1 FL=1